MSHRRRVVLALSCGLWTLLFVWLHLNGFSPLLQIENVTEDIRVRLGRAAPIDPRLVFIGIDQPTYADVPLDLDAEAQDSPTLRALRENFPWSRAVWAGLIDRLTQAGARVVILDLIFAAPGEGDEALAAALERHSDRVVVGSNFSDAHEGQAIKQTLPSSTLLPPPSHQSISQDRRVGFVNVWPDWDGVVRRACYGLSEAALLNLPGGGQPATHESLSARALRQAGLAKRVPPADQLLRFRYAAPPGLGFPAHPLNEIFSPKMWDRNYGAGEFFRDKIVIVGPSANFFHDEHPSPFTRPQPRMLGPEIHLNMLNAALKGEFLSESGRAAQLFLLIGSGVLALGLGFYVQPLRRLALIALSIPIWLLVVQGFYDLANLVVLCAGPLLILNLAGLSTFAYDYALERRERTRIRKTLERYVSKNVVKALLDNPEPYMNTLGGVRKPVSVLFADLRNFTSFTENRSEAEVVRQLNEYYTEMVSHVFSCDGTLDKFMGDALMAVWGNLLTNGPAADARHAVETALRMLKGLERLNQSWLASQRPALAAGIAINQGPAIVGNIGSTDKMELTVIGDTVNLASRLEGLTKLYKVDLLIGESVAQLVHPDFLLRLVDRVTVQGKSKPVDIFAVLGPRVSKTPDWLLDYETGVNLYRQRDFQAAIDHFTRAAQAKPEDYLCRLYLDRCGLLLTHPPAPDWTGAVASTQEKYLLCK